jgi:hypothetical protein
MRTGRPKQPLSLTEEERERLQSLTHRARSQPFLARRNALEHARLRKSHRTQPDHDQPDLAGLRSATISYRNIQTVARSATDRESARLVGLL